MTCIAYDGQMIAADSQETVAGTPVYTARKLRLIQYDGRYFVIGMSGTPNECYALLKHYLLGPRIMERPKHLDTALDAGIAVVELRLACGRKWSVTRVSGNGGVVDVTDRPWAWGSGADFAMGAMEAGATASIAVKAACKLDIHCAPPILSFDLADLHPAAFEPFTMTEETSHESYVQIHGETAAVGNGPAAPGVHRADRGDDGPGRPA